MVYILRRGWIWASETRITGWQWGNLTRCLTAVWLSTDKLHRLHSPLYDVSKVITHIGVEEGRVAVRDWGQEQRVDTAVSEF